VRPVNLIPPEERRGEKTPLRTGPVSYLIVGLLALAVGGVTLLVLTSNKIADRKAEVASLQSQVDAAQAQADRLSDYTSFTDLQQARQETVASLATSRFDWERALHELALVLPGDVWLTSMTAKASSDPSTAAASSTGSSAALGSVTGPSLDIHGCASGHDAVAKFLAALRDVDGVTRVTVLSSDRPGAEASSGGSSGSSSSDSSSVACASRDFIATFEVVAAFDGAQPTAATLAPPSPTSPAPPTSSTSSTTVAGGQGTTTPAQAQPAASGGANSNGGASPSAVVSGTGGTP
jgi:Tfp pilus assembly protein PilN